MSEVQEEDKGQKRRVGRSPAYPFISVQKALDKAKALYDQEGDYPAPLSSAVGSWGYSPKSSGGRQTLATMKYYGLIEVTGEGDARKVKVSDVARRILLDQREDDSEKRQLIRRVAITPSAHKALFEQYPNGLASDGTVEHFLIFDSGYNKEAARELLAEFKETARFAGFYQPSSLVDKPTDVVEADGDKQPPQFKVGDKVQVTVGGVDLFANGATVLGFSQDGAYVFIDKSDSGAKLEEVTLIEAVEAQEVERPAKPAGLMAAANDSTPKGHRKAVFPLDEGDVSLIFPEGLSADALTDLGSYLDIFLKKEQRKAS